MKILSNYLQKKVFLILYLLIYQKYLLAYLWHHQFLLAQLFHPKVLQSFVLGLQLHWSDLTQLKLMKQVLYLPQQKFEIELFQVDFDFQYFLFVRPVFLFFHFLLVHHQTIFLGLVLLHLNWLCLRTKFFVFRRYKVSQPNFLILIHLYICLAEHKCVVFHLFCE